MHIPDKSIYMPRRTFLRGLGVSLALPFLECMLPSARAAVGGAVRRMVFVYMPNGMDMENWTPKATGTNFELPSILQPLQPYKSQFSVLSGLAHGNAKPLGDPRIVFERLFSNEEDPDLAAGKALRESCRGSILDVVRADAKAFQTRLGATDRRKMDEYLTGLRETEVAIQQEAKFKATAAKPSSMEKPEGIPGDFTEHLKIMYDLLALALQTDATRIATMMVQHDGSNRAYPFIGVSDGHHDLSHHGNSPEKKEKIAKINRFHIEQFGYFLGKLKGMREGSGTVLDNSMIVCGSGIADGNAHAHNELPVILAGGGAGTLNPGRHVRFDKDTPMTNLYMAMFEKMGVKADRMGDSSGVLKNI